MNHGYGEMGSSRLYLVPGANLGYKDTGRLKGLLTMSLPLACT
jgi:hypothetical protein